MRVPALLSFLVTVAIVLAARPAPASAQIVNVQGALAGDPPTGWSGTVAATADWRTGNVDLILVGGAATALYRDGRWLGLVITRGEYGEGNGTGLSQKTFEHVRGRAALDERWLWEVLAQHEYDAFRRLSVRALAGTGPALRLVRGERARLVVGLAYLLELEQLDERVGTRDAGARTVAHRASTYVTGSYAVDPKIAATQTVYVQPRLDAPDDLRLLSESALTTKLSSHLATTTRLVVAHDASPPEGIESLDAQLRVELALTF